ncbi:hypothetical protein D3C79_810740 [compost metagenome]
MHQGNAARLVIVEQLLLAQPVEQLIGIWRLDDFAQGVAFLQAFDILPCSQQVQVMVAQHAGQRVADRVEVAQCLQRFRPAVDQVTDQPQAIDSRVELDALQQALEGLQAALQVTDGVGSHQCRAPGTARRKGAMSASKRLPSSANIW